MGTADKFRAFIFERLAMLSWKTLTGLFVAGLGMLGFHPWSSPAKKPARTVAAQPVQRPVPTRRIVILANCDDSGICRVVIGPA